MPLSSEKNSWIEILDDDDVMFIKRFVYASGSLKKVAKEYGISYPTVRLRLDRLIAKISVIDNYQVQDPFERLVRMKFAEGKLDQKTMVELLDAHNQSDNGEER